MRTICVHGIWQFWTSPAETQAKNVSIGPSISRKIGPEERHRVVFEPWRANRTTIIPVCGEFMQTNVRKEKV